MCLGAPTTRLAAKPPANGGLRVVLVVPPAGQPLPYAKKRLDLVMKDLQWWYSCQMEAHGYGPKTFPLELDQRGNLVVRVVRLEQQPPKDGNAVRTACVDAAQKVLGGFHQRRRTNTNLVVVYNNYIWRDRRKHLVDSHGRGAKNHYAFFTRWHINNVCPKLWKITAKPGTYRNRRRMINPLHLKVLAASFARYSIGTATSSGHGGFAHELGHVFGLGHPNKDNPDVRGNVMSRGLFHMSGNFLEEIENKWCCLSPHDAAVLDAHPLFKRYETAPPSTKARREVGARGARESREQVGAPHSGGDDK